MLGTIGCIEVDAGRHYVDQRHHDWFIRRSGISKKEDYVREGFRKGKGKGGGADECQ
jgi:hypothetical protein